MRWLVETAAVEPTLESARQSAACHEYRHGDAKPH
jgi:hypothetical protein